jgi:peptidoglycan/LPS O-acetylase OafA/YrhL
MENRDSRNRLAELDALRGVAVLMVLAFHYTTRFGQLFPQAASGASFPLGAYGVQLFFIISGFVIVMTLDRSERAVDFLVARFSRLYPAYWAAILATTALLWALAGPLEPAGARQLAANFTMLHGFFKVPSVDGVYWTLQVELLFYAASLAVFAAGLLRRTHLVALAWLALSALFYSPLWAVHIAGKPFAGLAVELLNLEYAPFFVIGIVFYRVYRREGAASVNYAVIAAALALIFLTQPGPISVLIAAACGVLWSLTRGGLRAMRFRPLVFVGTISYSLYLLHQNIGYAVMLQLVDRGWSPAAATALAACVSLTMATALTFLVECPALHAIRRKYKLLREGARPSRRRFQPVAGAMNARQR